MESKCVIIVYSILFLFFLSNCGNRNSVEQDGVVECRLYWISDTYPRDVDNTDENEMRFIRLHYLIINNTNDECFLPIEKALHFKGDSLFSSGMCASIDKTKIHTWFSTDTRWKGFLKPRDSIHAELKIPEWILDSAKIDKRIALVKLLKGLDIQYVKRLSDKRFSSLSIPQVYFTYNDTIAIYYRDSTLQLVNQSNQRTCPSD